LFLVYSPISSQVTVLSYVQTAVFGALFTVAVTLAGTILPYSEEYPFSAAASALLVTVAGVPLSYAFQRFVHAIPENSVTAFSLGFTLVLAALIYLVDGWRYRSDVDAV
jgi:branched-subunit amino acid ABC-type transport system permease component